MATQTLVLPAPPQFIHNWHRGRIKDRVPQPVAYEAWPLVDRLAVVRMPQTFQAFGVEMELLVPKKIGEQGLACAINSAAGNANWQIKEDASLYSYDDAYIPVEVVSPVLAGTDGLLNLVRVCNAINKLQPDVNDTCGLHVHVGCGSDGRDAWELSTLRRVAYNWLLHEPAMDLLMDPSRRSSKNEYCMPLRQGFHSSQRLSRAAPDVYKEYLELLRDGCDDITDADFFPCNIEDHNTFDCDVRAALSQVKWALKSCTSLKRLMYCVSPYGRRYKMNLHSITRHNTIEFRHPAGSWDASEIAHYVLLYMRFLESSAMCVGKPYLLPDDMHRYDSRSLQRLKDMMFSSDSLLDQELRLWIEHRAGQLARQAPHQRVDDALHMSKCMFALPVDALL